MHTVVLGWFGVSVIWLLPVAVRFVIAACLREPGARGRGAIRLWLGFAGVYIGSAAIEAALAPHTGNALGHALLSGAVRALGRGALFALPVLMLASLPWLIGFRWGDALRWADRAFGLGLKMQPRAASRHAATGTRGLGGSAVRTSMTNANPMAPKSTGRYARPTAWQPPSASHAARSAAANMPGATRGIGPDVSGPNAASFKMGKPARSVRRNLGLPPGEAASGARPAANTPRSINAMDPKRLMNAPGAAHEAGVRHRSFSAHSQAADRPVAAPLRPRPAGSAPAVAAAAGSAQYGQTMPAAGSGRPVHMPPAVPAQPTEEGATPIDAAHRSSAPAAPSAPPPGVLETLRAIEANAAQWTAIASSSLTRRGAAPAPRPDATASAPSTPRPEIATDAPSLDAPVATGEPTSAAAHQPPPSTASIPPEAPTDAAFEPGPIAPERDEQPEQFFDRAPAQVETTARATASESNTSSTELSATASMPPWAEDGEPIAWPMTGAPRQAETALAPSSPAVPLPEAASYAPAFAAEPHAATSMPASAPSSMGPVAAANAEPPSIIESAPRPAVRVQSGPEFTFHAPAASAVELPTLNLLEPASAETEEIPAERLTETGQLIEQRLQEFKVPVTVVGASAGPVITRFEIEPALGVRGSQIVGLMKDLSRGLGLTSIRVVETIPGKTCMGLELPNAKRQTIRLSEILAAAPYRDSASKLTLAMGKDITGHPVVTDLAKAPHMLVAGTTGSGKSVAINAMIVSLLYKATPDEVRMIMIDPKMLELSVYEGIAHLLAPVVTDMKLAANALNWCVGEMERRYRLMSALGVRNLAGFNQKLRDAHAAGKKIGNPFSLTPEAPEPLAALPMIVVVIDELADLMMVAGKKIEELIARLAQKARAAGIHLILATQRPSVDVITGLIKANIPTRVAFQVSSKIDSRTILDQMGAESLLGQGDMLFLPPGTGYPQRVHGAFVADEEVHRVVEHLKQFGEPQYEEGILDGPATDGAAQDLFGDAVDAEADPLYDEAVAFVVRTRRASISAVQRQLRIGYNRAARLVEQMEAAGLVSSMSVNGSREVLAPPSSEP